MFQTQEVPISSIAMEMPSLASNSGRCVSASFWSMMHSFQKIEKKKRREGIKREQWSPFINKRIISKTNSEKFNVLSFRIWLRERERVLLATQSSQGYQHHSASTLSAVKISSSSQAYIPVTNTTNKNNTKISNPNFFRI